MEPFALLSDEYVSELAARPVAYFATLFSMLLICLLNFEWLWRKGWEFVEKPHPLRHPVTAYRLIIVFLLLSAILRIVPNVARLLTFPEGDTATDRFLINLDSVGDSLSWIPFFFAWIVSYIAGPMIMYQLATRPIPINLWPTRRDLVRPFKIMVGVLVIATAATLGR